MSRWPQVTQRDVDKVNELRARFEPLAQMIGVAYDDSDTELMDLLFSIERQRGKQARGNKPGASVGQSGLAQPVRGQMRTPCSIGDVGDQAVALMAARRGKALSAAVDGLAAEKRKP